MAFVIPRWRPLNDLLTLSNRAVYRMTGGRAGNRFAGAPVYLLITAGRKSGRERTLPLLFLEDNGSLVVAASNFGHDNHPGWYLNLQADPHARVNKGFETIEVTAEEAEGPERERLWERFTKLYSGYDEYGRRTSRRIPIVVLKPRAIETRSGDT